MDLSTHNFTIFTFLPFIVINKKYIKLLFFIFFKRKLNFMEMDKNKCPFLISVHIYKTQKNTFSRFLKLLLTTFDFCNILFC